MPVRAIVIVAALIVAGAAVWWVTKRDADRNTPGAEVGSTAGPVSFEELALPEGVGLPVGNHTATLLDDGRVLLVGGDDAAGGLFAHGAIYDSGVWKITPPIAHPRKLHSAVRLAGGVVMIAGGGDSGEQTDSVELYDPVANIWRAGAPMSAPRSGHTATLLGDGRVMVAGGLNNASGLLASTEIYDPRADTWRPGPPLDRARSGHVAVALSNGSVMVIGGMGRLSERRVVEAEATSPVTGETVAVIPDLDVTAKGAIADVEIYALAEPEWRPWPALSVPRTMAAVAVMAGDRVAVVNGATGSLGDMMAGVPAGFREVASLEIFDSSTQSWSASASPAYARTGHSATVLTDGRILVLGGIMGWNRHGTAEIYDPRDGAWADPVPVIHSVLDHTATPLPDGRILVVESKAWLVSVE